MSLLDAPLLLLDCQTTGTSAARDHLLEIAWTTSSALDSYPPLIHTALFRPPVELPKRVTELTGLTEADLAQAEEPSLAYRRLSTSPSPAFALAHYAQFERPFLKKLYADHGQEFSLPLLCSYRIAKRLFPEAPSGNIRGLAGYLGYELPEIRRAADHVRATTLIWQRIASDLHRLGVENLAGLEKWVAAKPAATSVRKNFRVDRLKRLQLPDEPGIYRMLSKGGEILYVGKATSLKSRVNSYFRGGCKGDRRKLELLARVWDIHTETCASALESALRETDEIKKHNPRYNRALKSTGINLLYFSRDGACASNAQDEKHPLGPFRDNSSIAQVFDWLRLWGAEELAEILYDPVSAEFMAEGFLRFCAAHGFDPEAAPSLRHLLAIGLRQWRRDQKIRLRELEAQEAQAPAEEDTGTEDEISGAGEEEIELPEPERVHLSLDHLLGRAAQDYLRAKRLTRLLNSCVRWETERGDWRSLFFANGSVHNGPQARPAHPWAGLTTADFDRMTVLQSELNKCEHRITSHPRQ